MLSPDVVGSGDARCQDRRWVLFWHRFQHINLVSIGLNCSFGATDRKPYLAELAKHAPYFISAYPNAGLPNSFRYVR